MRGWESDPLFAAAEVVQDSADRMESIFRLLLHEQSVVQGDHIDGKHLSSIEYHRRALATTLETAKWQLEDFEREVNGSAITDKSWVKQNMIERHMQFIAAIRQQIIHVEQSMSTSVGNSVRNMNLNEQDRDGLALFLSGGKPVKHIADQESEDNNILRRFLDPAVSSSSKEDIDEKKAGQTVSLNVNEIVYSDHNIELKENFTTKLDLGPSTSGHDANFGRCEEEGTWDLESNEAKGKTYLQKNKLGGYWGRMNISKSLGNFFAMHKSRASRSFTKRLKDGEEQSNDVHPGMQRDLAQLSSAFGSSIFHLSCSQLSAQTAQLSCWIRDHREKCQRSLHHIQAKYHPALIIFAMLLILFTLSMVVA